MRQVVRQRISRQLGETSVPSWPAKTTLPTATATAPATSITTATAPGAFLARPCDIHCEIAPVQARAVHCGQGLLGFFIGAHCDKSESARTARGAVCHQVGFEDSAMRGESVLQIIFRRVEGDISDKQFIIHLVVFVSS
jgi:hypothetical protein